MANEFAKTPEPPYYAVIFSSQRTEADDAGYAAMAEAMDHAVRKHPGFLGIESVRGADGRGITVGYFRDETAILAWKQNTGHQAAQRGGMERWYNHYELRVAKVERAYAGPEGRTLDASGKERRP